MPLTQKIYFHNKNKIDFSETIVYPIQIGCKFNFILYLL